MNHLPGQSFASRARRGLGGTSTMSTNCTCLPCCKPRELKEPMSRFRALLAVLPMTVYAGYVIHITSDDVKCNKDILGFLRWTYVLGCVALGPAVAALGPAPPDSGRRGTRAPVSPFGYLGNPPRFEEAGSDCQRFRRGARILARAIVGVGVGQSERNGGRGC